MTLRFAPPSVVRRERPDGGFVLASTLPLPPLPRSVTDKLAHWAEHAPHRIYLAERSDAAFRRLDYATTWDLVQRLGQALLDLGLGPTRPLLIVADNGIDHALLMLAGLHVGVPVAPVSVAYALTPAAHGKLRDVASQVQPGAVYVHDGQRFADAVGALALTVPVIASLHPEACGALHFDDLAATPVGVACTEAAAAIGLDHVAKILFTSGSTGVPRGIVNTQRMLASNQEAMAAGWPFLRELVPNVVDWLPWSHTFGGNHNFFMVLWHGGTLTIDAGKPAPGAFDVTLDNLRAVRPNLYFNVPRGFDLLVDRLERDPELARDVLEGLELIFYAAAPLSPTTWQRLERLVVSVRPTPIAMVSAWGSTETSPLATQVHFPIDRAGVIGLPVAGSELAFVPHGDTLELRLRGPQVSPGTWLPGGGVEPLPLDADGFWATGDAGRLEDETAPEHGVRFEGRLGENFKLASGTWVSVGQVRLALVAAFAPHVADAVITGHDRDELCALLFLAPGGTADDDTLAACLSAHQQIESSSSKCVHRVLVLREPPDLGAGEITDKGYLNQRAVLQRRRADVEALYVPDAAPLLRRT